MPAGKAVSSMYLKRGSCSLERVMRFGLMEYVVLGFARDVKVTSAMLEWLSNRSTWVEDGVRASVRARVAGP